MTPYIFDDRASHKDITNAIDEWFLMGEEKRRECGLLGHEFITGAGDMASEKMGEKFIEAIDGCFDNWKPRKRFDIHKI